VNAPGVPFEHWIRIANHNGRRADRFCPNGQMQTVVGTQLDLGDEQLRPATQERLRLVEIPGHDRLMARGS